MAESSNVFYIRAQAQGFDRVSSAARKLTEDFKATGRAGQQMGNQVAQGLTRMHHHPHRGSHAPRPGARHPHHHRAGGVMAFPNQQGFGGGGGGGGGGFGGGGGGGFPPGQGPPGGGGGGGGFLQGLLQGTTGNIYLPRGPGMLRQTAGVTLGRMASSVASSITGGPDAILGGVASIPVVGGMMAQAFGSGISAGREEGSYQSGISHMMPYIDDTRGAFYGRMEAQRERVGRVGRAFGMAPGQALESIAQAVSSSGGTVRDLDEDRIGRIFAAQRAYGIDAGTGAAFARGEDLGATSGGDTEGTAIQGAKRLNLKGSELIQYVKAIASNVQSFSQTGIKVDAADETNVARMFQLTGGSTMTGQRAAMLGQGFESTATSISQNGPQDANQAALLMAAGWNPEDPSTYLQAMRNLEDPKKRAQYLAQAEDDVRNANRDLDPLQQAEAMRSFTRSNTGVQLTGAQADAMVASSGKNRHAARDVLAYAAAEPQQLPAEARAAQGEDNISFPEKVHADLATRREDIGKEEVNQVLVSEYNAQVVSNTKQMRYVGNKLLDLGNFISTAGQGIISGLFSDTDGGGGGGHAMPKPH